MRQLLRLLLTVARRDLVPQLCLCAVRQLRLPLQRKKPQKLKKRDKKPVLPDPLTRRPWTAVARQRLPPVERQLKLPSAFKPALLLQTAKNKHVHRVGQLLPKKLRVAEPTKNSNVLHKGHY